MANVSTHDLRWGLVSGLYLNLAVAAILNNTLGAFGAWLVTFGATNELLGLLLVASPELEPRVADLEGLSRALILATADRRIQLRLLGVGYVIVGLVLSWLGNLH